MMLLPALTLTAFTMFFPQWRLPEKSLADIAVIRVPRGVKQPYKGVGDDQIGRLVFAFEDGYLWASFGSGMAYKQRLFVSVMAPDATDSEYEAMPSRYNLTYEPRKTIKTMTVGSGTLRVSEGIYRQNLLQAPAHTYVYVDRKRRLQIVWHAVTKEVDLETGIDVIGRMAASFRITSDPTARWVAMRDRPRREAEDRSRKRALALETLKREGYWPLEPDKPVLRKDVYAEWTEDPEPRFQLLLPLGRVRVAPGTPESSRPRPAKPRNADGSVIEWPGSVGWRDYVDGEWALSNDDNDYMPFGGIAAALAALQPNKDYVYFYYSATVRVEQVSDDTRIASLAWYLDRLPEMRRLWREGKLVSGGNPETE